VTGGDFNGDGVGDVVASYWESAPREVGEIHYHFGSAYIDSTTDLLVTQNDYGGRYELLGFSIGAVADYNGDGADDLASRVFGDVRVVLLGGRREWEASVSSDDSPLPDDFSLEVFPNPFNNEMKISYTVTKPNHYNVSVFDTGGRRISTAFDGYQNPGSFSASWQSPCSGIYFVVLSSTNGNRLVNKAICIR
jgi:hypothetical protein